MKHTDPLKDLELLIRSRYGLILVESPDEERITTLLRHLADRLSLPLFTWSRTHGLRRDGLEQGIYGTVDPVKALAHLTATDLDALYHIPDPGSALEQETFSEGLHEAAAAFSRRAGAVLLSGESLQLPETLQRQAARVSLPAPDVAEFRSLLASLLRDLSDRMEVTVEMPPKDITRLLQSLRGLTLLEAEKILTKAIIEDGRLAADDIAHVIAAKQEIVEREGVLEYYPQQEGMADIADLAGLKAWLAKRRHMVTEPEAAAAFGLSFPKGVLLVGVPGCGKSLCARAVAREWALPLLKLDPGTLYNKYIGESEHNFRRAMEVAERLAPCVLFIDELEKAFAAGGSEDGGVSQRVLGTFLGWLQERQGDVFVVATANDISRLPPEFLRKGRFDEVFFVDLPGPEARQEILRIHLEKRGHSAEHFDLSGLAAATDGFSGAELEQVVVAALYTAFSDHQPLSDALLQHEVGATRPLSRMLAEKVAALRAWARGRTVTAN